MPDAVSSAVLTDTSSVNWTTIPCSDVVKLKSGNLESFTFSSLHSCAARLSGRALGRISGPVSLSLYSSASDFTVCAVGVTPSGSSDSTPKDVPQVLACGGVVLRESPYISSGSQILNLDVVGITRDLKSTSLPTMVGNPPYLHTFTSSKAKDGTASSGEVYLIIKYSLEISGYDWVKPF